MTQFVTIERIGAKGDGVAETDAGPLFIPRGIPGDVYRIDHDADAGEKFHLETPSPHRVTPFCSAFGQCGGCAIQDAEQKIYAQWKKELVGSALAPLGLSDRVTDFIDAHGAGRRRVTFHARRRDGDIVIGFMRAKSHEVIDLNSCPLLVPQLQDSALRLKPLARLLLKSDKPIDIAVTATPNGLNVDLRGHGPASPELRMKLTRESELLDLARLSLHGDIIVERRAPLIAIGKASVILPPGCFLQATETGEDALQSAVLSHLKDARKVADLFAGIGTFALRLAEYASVHALENDPASINALVRATRDVSGLKPVTVETRDLFRRPLVPLELNAFDHVVIDPPRAGAEAQMRMLASSRVSRVISVSCHLGSFVRDAALLLAGGYQLGKVTVIDQFRHSTHCELVGIFERETERAKPKRRLLG